MTMSVDGLVSGMDTTSLVQQLLAAEAAPKRQLEAKVATTQTQASGYRAVNATFAAVRAAAEALTSTSLATARKTSSSVDSVTARAAATAVDGASITFSITNLAAKQTSMSETEWSSLTAPVRTAKDGTTAEPAWPIEIRLADGTSKTVTVGPAATLTEAVTAINDAKAGVSATAVRLGDGTFRMQITSTATGLDNGFEIRSATEPDADGNYGLSFTRTVEPLDAVIDLGGGITASSSSNTFDDLLGGVAVTLSKEVAGPVTVSVNQDADGVASKVQTLVDAVNAALNTVRTYTSNEPGRTATLKGDPSLTKLAGELLTAVSGAVTNTSPVKVGLQLTKDGKNITFDKGVFTTALKADPALAQRMVSGRTAGPGLNGVAGDGDDVTAVKGIAGRLFDVAKAASDSTTGSIVALAKGRDSQAADLKNRIESWDLRLVKRKEMLTRQFSAMETALSSLRNQSTWLAGQINSLPSYG